MGGIPIVRIPKSPASGDWPLRRVRPAPAPEANKYLRPYIRKGWEMKL